MIFNTMRDKRDIKANIFSTTDVHYNWIPAKPNKWNKNKSFCLTSYLAQHNTGKKKKLALLTHPEFAWI